MVYAVVGADPGLRDKIVEEHAKDFAANQSVLTTLIDQQTASEKPSLQKQRVPQFVYEAKYTFMGDAELNEGSQLIGAANLRKALVKFERWADAQGLRDVDLMSLAVKSDVVI